MQEPLAAIGIVVMIFLACFCLGSTGAYWSGPLYSTCQKEWPLGVAAIYSKVETPK